MLHSPSLFLFAGLLHFVTITLSTLYSKCHCLTRLVSTVDESFNPKMNTYGTVKMYKPRTCPSHGFDGQFTFEHTLKLSVTNSFVFQQWLLRQALPAFAPAITSSDSGDFTPDFSRRDILLCYSAGCSRSLYHLCTAHSLFTSVSSLS